MAVLVAFLVLGASGAFGVKSATARGSGGGYEIAVTYARVSRPGLATPWSAAVRREGGFDGPVVLAVRSSFFEVFDENGLDPDPSKVTASREWTYLEFDPPPGDTLTVSFDARIEPGVQLRSVRGETAVIDRGTRAATVRYTMRVMP